MKLWSRDWRQANLSRVHDSRGIRRYIGADDGYCEGPDLLQNLELRGTWGDRIHFWIYCFILRSAFLAVGLRLTHERSVPSACQRVSSWRGARLNPPRSGEATVAAAGERCCARRERLVGDQRTCKHAGAHFHWSFGFSLYKPLLPVFRWKSNASVLAAQKNAWNWRYKNDTKMGSGGESLAVACRSIHRP